MGAVCENEAGVGRKASSSVGDERVMLRISSSGEA